MAEGEQSPSAKRQVHIMTRIELIRKKPIAKLVESMHGCNCEDPSNARAGIGAKPRKSTFKVASPVLRVRARCAHEPTVLSPNVPPTV